MENTNCYFTDIIISVDDREWYYGRKKNLNIPENRLLMKSLLPKDSCVLPQYLQEINSYYMQVMNEKTTKKHTQRPMYIDKSFLVNPNFHF